MLVEAVRTLARERIAPRAAEVDHTAEFPWDAVELLRENDVFALAFPEEYGGTGTGMLTTCGRSRSCRGPTPPSGCVLAVQGLGGAAGDARRHRGAAQPVRAAVGERRVDRGLRADRAGRRLRRRRR